MAAPGNEFTVDSGSPFALALAAARAARERRDVAGMNTGYREAVRLAHDLSAQQPGLRSAVAVEHISALRDVGESTSAFGRCEAYLTEYGEDARLLLVRAETKLTRGDHREVEADIAAIHRITGGRPAVPADDALLSRLEGLVAAHRRQFRPAVEHLRRSRDLYAKLKDASAVAALDDDLRIVAARQGTSTSKRSARPREGSPQARLTRSEELRAVGRYEDALTELAPALAGPLDPALRFFFLQAKVRLLRLLRADDEADEVMPDLYEAAHASARPEENLKAARRFDPAMAVEPDALGIDDQLLRTHWLIKEGRLADAERLLVAEDAPAGPDDRRIAEWHLATAELKMAIARHTANQRIKQAVVKQAVIHSQECVRHAAADSLVAIRISGWRVQGHAYAALDRGAHMDQAVEAWAQAHRTEESVVLLQPTDRFRLRMLHAVPTEFDERIGWACAQADRLGEHRANALIVIAMEAARGAAILPHILPNRQAPTRKLPDPGDVAGARRWIRRAVRGLPRSQIIWMLHATTDEIHHAFIERTVRGVRIRHQPVSCDRKKLITAIDAVAEFWKKVDAQELARFKWHQQTFDELLRTVANLLGMRNLPELPGHVKRIAVVAGGELSEIPFALLPCPELIGRRYALSDLPCLSVRAPLQRRSRGQRGTHPKRMLLLHGPKNKKNVAIAPANEVPGRTVLGREYTSERPPATPAALRAELLTGQYRQVRIDSHGAYGDDPVLLLDKPDTKEAEELRPDQFEQMNLGPTGTLVLGACETGMFKRIGRDERTGFVRAALAAGASAVLAARWEAANDVAARILDRFERNLRGHPRDVALHLAQREADTPDRHPTIWAALTLYGASGYQTRRGPLMRWLARWRST